MKSFFVILVTSLFLVSLNSGCRKTGKNGTVIIFKGRLLQDCDGKPIGSTSLVMTFISNDIFHQKDNGILGETVTDPEGYFSIQANYPGTGTIDISHEYNQTTSNSFVHNYPIPYDDVKVIDFGKIYETVSFYAVAKITAIGTYKPNDTLFFGPPSDVMAIYPIVPNHEYIRVFGVSLVGVNFVLQDTFNIGAAIGIGKRIYDSAWKNMTRTHGLKLTGSLCTTHDTSRFVIP